VLHVVVRGYPRILRDSKQLLAEITLDGFVPSSDAWFLTLDLEDFFNRIDLKGLQISLARALEKTYGPGRDASFAARLCATILDNKYLAVNETIVKKRNTLSTGERIATDAANIYREQVFDGLISSTTAIERFTGYVDDCFAVMHGREHDVWAFIDRLRSVDPEHFVWTVNVERECVHYLDLEIEKHISYPDTGKVCTRTYIKPKCNHQYLPFFSQHPTHSKVGVFRGEAIRHMLNCSAQADYEFHIRRMRAALLRRGYPSGCLKAPPYDATLRRNMLERLRDRPQCGFSAGEFSADKRMTPSTMILKCQFSPQLRRAGLRTHFKRMVQAVRTHIGEDFLRNERLIIAHPIRDNSFLREYKLNFVESTRKSTTRRTS